MCERVVERNLDYAMDATLAKPKSTTMELKTERDMFPERGDEGERIYFCFPFEWVGWRVGWLLGIRSVRS